MADSVHSPETQLVIVFKSGDSNGSHNCANFGSEFMCKDYCTKFIEMILMVTADHGPAVSGAHNTIVTARAGEVGSKCMHSCQNCARIRARGFPLCSDMQYTQYMATK